LAELICGIRKNFLSLEKEKSYDSFKLPKKFCEQVKYVIPRHGRKQTSLTTSMQFTINTFVPGISNPYANCFNRVAIRSTIIFLKTLSRLFFARTQYALARYGLPFCRFGLMKDKTIQIIHLLPQLKPSPQAILFALLSNSFLFSGLAEIYYLRYIYRFYLFLYMNLYTGQEKLIFSTDISCISFIYIHL